MGEVRKETELGDYDATSKALRSLSLRALRTAPGALETC